MALSEREKRLLAEMEEALSLEDPHLLSTLTGKGPSPVRTRFLVGLGFLLLGLATLLGGLISQTIPVGVTGFIFALAGVVFAISNFSFSRLGKEKPARPPRRKWTNGLEERWDRRDI